MASPNKPSTIGVKKYRDFSASEAKHLKTLEAENARLKRLLAEKELEILDLFSTSF